MINDDLDRILIDRGAIAERVRALAGEVAATYADQPGGLTLVPVLSGSIIFLADLIRELPLRMKVALVHVSTYPGSATTPQTQRVVLELSGDVKDRNVLIVDDILDSGKTLRRVQAMVRERGARSVRSIVLLRKPSKAPADVPVEFVGFDVEDLFVVGYGLDYDDLYRNYPHVGVLKPGLIR
ncbi:MAG: hypoxanthine phosphoribosyltransferase [Phycisphaerales bacterium]|nr:hypoxanthine phosphoribosyltransferase [Phycisphaerales bacterium]